MLERRLRRLALCGALSALSACAGAPLEQTQLADQQPPPARVGAGIHGLPPLGNPRPKLLPGEVDAEEDWPD